jgi:hypothetical protein
MKWDIYKAKAWMLRSGMDHIRDGLYAEGGEMVYEAKWGDACETESNFRELLTEVLCWDTDLIDDVVKEILT